MAALGRDYAKQIAIVAISSNDAKSHPGDAPASLKEQAQELGFTFPYLYDESQEVARAYHAACTPDFFLFDKSRRLVYRGQFDSSRPGNGIAVSGEDLRRAIDAMLQGKPLSAEQRPSVGCSIKWKRLGPARTARRGFAAKSLSMGGELRSEPRRAMERAKQEGESSFTAKPYNQMPLPLLEVDHLSISSAIRRRCAI